MRMLRLLTPLLLLAGIALAQGRGGNLWSRLRGSDADGDGKISRDEFPMPDRFFDRLDADKDGFVTEEEARAMRRGRGGNRGGRGPGGRGGGGRGLQQRFDADKDGKVSREEWDAFFKKADENGDDLLQPEELMAAMRGRAYRDNAPKVGDKAPKVGAYSPGDGRKVDLSRPGRATVLIFGSWT